MWLELQLPSMNAPSFLFVCFFVCLFYQNLSESYEWFDDFVKMIDNPRAVKHNADIPLSGDFNTDLLKPYSSWDSITLLGLTQLVKSPTGITPASATLFDHIMYLNSPDAFTAVGVPDLSISDYCFISCTRSDKLPQRKFHTHSLLSIRSSKHFDPTAFCTDLSCVPFIPVLDCTDPKEALSVWYNVYLTVVNRHAPLKHNIPNNHPG